MSQTQVDLRELALDRPPAQQSRPATRPRRSPVLSRYVVPGVVLAGFIGLLLWAVGDRFLPRPTVTVVPVVITRAEVQQEGTPLFQAAGWVEPRPTPINVAALTPGVVEELLVVEGQDVQAGEPLARLIAVDARLALREAEASRQLRQAEFDSAQAELKAARIRHEKPVHLEAQLAEAESLLAKTRTELSGAPFLIETARARLKFAEQNLAGKQAGGAAVSTRLLQQAQRDVTQAGAELRELLQRVPRLEEQVQALTKRADALEKQLALLIDETRMLENAAAQVAAARARLNEAEVAVEKAKLELDRTVISAPVAGRVLRLVAHPGSRVMGLKTEASHSSSTVVSMYEPSMLQVRADVRLEDVPFVQAGQPVEVETASSKQTIRGTVLRATSTANIQKNTLEVKVALEAPPDTIRPEMLVTATFLAPPSTEPSDDESGKSESLLIPRELVQQDEGGAQVWIVDASGVARRKSVKLGRAGSEALVEVLEGLTPTDRLISSPTEELENGQPVRISEEDSRLGMESA